MEPKYCPHCGKELVTAVSKPKRKPVAKREVVVLCNHDFDWKPLLLSFDEWVEELDAGTSTKMFGSLEGIGGFDGTLKCVDGSELPKEVKLRDDLGMHHADGGFFGFLRVREIADGRKTAWVKNQGRWQIKVS